MWHLVGPGMGQSEGTFCITEYILKHFNGPVVLDADGINVIRSHKDIMRLRRLENQRLLESPWETSGAKPRKYYVITRLGEEVYLELKRQWEESTQNMMNLLEN